MSRIVGIDLGTTYSLVAYVDGQEAKVISDEKGRSLLPSVISLDTNGEILVGWDARSKRVKLPTLTISSVKRLMGKGSREVGTEEDFIPFKLDKSDEKIVRIELGSKTLTPPEVSALILKELKKRAENFFGEPVTQAVITVPAYFNESQREATRVAGQIAGFEVRRIVNEPTAAALAYGLHKKKRGKIAVFDLGGGTFDLSILNLHEGIFEVLATSGDTHLGGDDLDWRIAKKFLEELENQFGKWVREDLEFKQQVLEEAERAKIALSRTPSADVHIQNEKRKLDWKRAFSRYELNELTRDIIERTVPPCLQALRDAKLQPSEIDEVILVGGMTRMPLVQTTAEKIFEKKAHSEINPDEVVALGAAIQAHILSGEIKNLLLLDVTPLSLGIETFGGVTSVLIPRNTTIPAQAKEMFTTFVDGQTSVDIHVLQGERELAQDNRSLGRFQLRGIEPMPAGLPRIEVIFLIDENGLLRVKARDDRTGKEQAIEVKPSFGLKDEEVEKMIQESFLHAKEDMEIRLLVETKNQAQISLQGAKKALKLGTQTVNGKERKAIEQAVQSLEKLLAGEDRGAIGKAREHLEKTAKPLAERLMNAAVKEALAGKKLSDVGESS